MSACEAVRERRKTVAARIDQAAAEKPGADVLSVACGHLREAELSLALQTNRIGTFYAVDQDPLCFSAVEQYVSASGGRIRPRRMGVRDLIGERHDLPQFDLIYSAGLYDYLQAPSAARLTHKLFGQLKSGGTLLLANFLEGIWETPYMEAYMDWYLTYRSEREINGFLSEVPETQIASRCYWTDRNQRIGYLAVSRR